MSDIIQLLPDSVANQIAAGEVIQRPASVIKELVENAIDAGATSIQVLVVDAGRTSIQVIDNGKGMSETDARLSFERHATSKIRKADDLFALHTMGFRGEALASIAAVAQVELVTRMADKDLGTRLSIAGSKVQGQEPVPAPVGSNFTVQNLFYNVPARRKFLKTNATELSNIMTAYERMVLVYPSIAFSLHSNGTELMALRAGNLRQRVVDVFGKRINQDLLPLEVETAMGKIRGFIGKPESARKKGAHQYFFVNGRYMKHPYFHKAVMAAYERLVPPGVQTPYFIYFDVNPGDIDVNIHPTKTEIKFENEQAIYQILTTAVKDAIGRFCEVTAIDFDTEGKPDIPLFDPSMQVDLPSPSYNPAYNPFSSGHSPSRSPKAPAQWERLYDNLPDGQAVGQDMFGQGDAPEMQGGEILEGNLISGKSPTHYQYKERYIMTAVKSGLMIIDQHRADVRIRYERFLESLQGRPGETQRVLFPETVQFPPSSLALLPTILPGLQALGFDLSDLGGGGYGINGVPVGIGQAAPASLLMQMVGDAVEGGSGAEDAVRKSLAASMASSTAVPSGQMLTNEEMEDMVNQLFSCSNVNYTPDGKAILCILPQRDIEQLLG